MTLCLAEQVDVELLLPGEGTEPVASLQAAAQGPAQHSSCSRIAPVQHEHPTRDRPFLYFPRPTQAARKSFFICCITVYNNRVTSFSDSKESLRAVWGLNIKTL